MDRDNQKLRVNIRLKLSLYWTLAVLCGFSLTVYEVVADLHVICLGITLQVGKCDTTWEGLF